MSSRSSTAAARSPHEVGALPGVATHRVIERLVAVGYGLTYDAIVSGFRPYQALLDEIVAFLARSCSAVRRSTRVLDVACGTGTVAFRLAREGYTVVGLDPVARLVEVARSRISSRERSTPTFRTVDLARDPLPEAGTYDALVSMHTLYWHQEPQGLLTGCRRALKPGGHAVFLTYTRPARVFETFRDVRAREGLGPAARALRWLVPTAVFEGLRQFQPHYMSQEEFHRALAEAGFEVLESRETFLAGISLIAWVKKRA